MKQLAAKAFESKCFIHYICYIILFSSLQLSRRKDHSQYPIANKSLSVCRLVSAAEIPFHEDMYVD